MIKEQKPNGTVETINVTSLEDGLRILAFFFDKSEANRSTGLHGFSGPASTRDKTIEVVWIDGNAYPFDRDSYIIGGPIGNRIKNLSPIKKASYKYSRGHGMSPEKSLLKALG